MHFCFFSPALEINDFSNQRIFFPVGAFFASGILKKRLSELKQCTEIFLFPGSCTRTTPGTTTPRPAAAAPLRPSQSPSQAAAARSEVRSLPQATR